MKTTPRRSVQRLGVGPTAGGRRLLAIRRPLVARVAGALAVISGRSPLATGARPWPTRWADRQAADPPLDPSRRGADIHRLMDRYTDAVLAELQSCVERAATAIGSGDPDALERVRLVATGLEYTRKTRDLLAAVAAVREQRSEHARFEKIHAEVLAYYRTLATTVPDPGAIPPPPARRARSRDPHPDRGYRRPSYQG